jgi:hypothetical protein
MLGLILAGAQLLGGGLKAVGANQERQRNKGIIGRAYGIARERLARRHQDVRQGTAESLNARGLSAGVTAAGPRGPRTAIPKGGPSPIAAAYQPHTLGAQQTADNEQEFALERKDLDSREEMARAGINQAANAGIAGGITEGVTGAISSYYGAQNPAGDGGSPIASAYGKGTMVDTPARGASSSPYANSFLGIDPVDPLGRGAWKSPDTTGGFNVFNEDVS